MVTQEEGEAPVRWENPHGFTLSWVARGWSFGTVSFGEREEGGLYCGDEYMGLKNAQLMLARFCEKTPEAEWPELLRRYGSATALLTEVVDWESKPRESASEPTSEPKPL